MPPTKRKAPAQTLDKGNGKKARVLPDDAPATRRTRNTKNDGDAVAKGEDALAQPATNDRPTRTEKKPVNNAVAIAGRPSRQKHTVATTGGRNADAGAITKGRHIPAAIANGRPLRAARRTEKVAAAADQPPGARRRRTEAGSAKGRSAAGRSTVAVEVPGSRRTSTETPTEAEPSDEDEDGERSYWLMKAEPESRMEKGVDVKFSIDDLAAKTEPEAWDGVRNATARNNMRAMLKGDLAFFYHSNCKVPGIVGIMEIVREHSPDASALDPNHPYHDPKASAGNNDGNKWCVVHVAFRARFDKPVKLKELQGFAKAGGALEKMQALRMSRLSVSRVSKREWDFILALADADPTEFEGKGGAGEGGGGGGGEGEGVGGVDRAGANGGEDVEGQPDAG